MDFTGMHSVSPKSECIKKYGSAKVWTEFTDLFDYMVLSVLIDHEIMCVHGGLSPSIHTMDQIKVLHRFQEVPHDGAMSDLVWSDPIDSIDHSKHMFSLSPRGAGYVFGVEAVRQFAHTNGLSHLCRAHQLCMEG